MTFPAAHPVHPTMPFGPEPTAAAAPREIVRARTIASAQTAMLIIASAVSFVLAATANPTADDGWGEGLVVVIGVFAGSVSLLAAGLIGTPALLLRPHRPASRVTLVVVEWVVVVYGVASLSLTVGSPDLLVYSIPILVGTALAAVVIVQLGRPQARQWCARAR